MYYDLAPMEGITTYIYRSTFEIYYGGIDRYYTPFFSPTGEHRFSPACT